MNTNGNKFCILLTAQNCGHCHHYRGDGIINSNQAYMHPEFIKKIISPYKDIKLSLLNIHYYDMSNTSNNGIKDISKTYILKNNIVQEIFYPSQDRNKTHVDLRTFDTKKNQVKLRFSKKEILKNNNSVEWLKFIGDKISPMLINYTYVFPGFLLVDKNNWTQTFDKKTQLLAFLNIGWTIETKDGKIMLEKNEKSLRERSEDIFQMIEKYVINNTKMVPHKSEKSEKIEEVKDTKETKDTKKEKKIKEVKEVKDTKKEKKIVQVSYDD